MSAKVMTRSAILARLGNYAASAATRGESARADVLALASDVAAKDFGAIISAIGAMRLGHVMPVADRDAIIAEWSDKARTGGAVQGKDIAAALGVVPSTVTLSKKAATAAKSNSDESADGPEPTAEEIAAAEETIRVKRLTSMLANLRKITAEIGEPSSDVVTLLDQIAGECAKPMA